MDELNKRAGKNASLTARSAAVILNHRPILGVARFLLLTLLTWFHPRLRHIIYQRASSLVIDTSCIRPAATRNVLWIIRFQEVCCFLWCFGIAAVPRVFFGQWPIPFVIHAYLTGVAIISINTIRTLGSHRWSNDGEEMTFVEQMLDSVDYPHRAPITELWGPVGTRFHALHHLFPSLPYHAMPAAHRRLTAQLPSDSPYRLTQRVTLFGALRELWQQAGASSADRDKAESEMIAV